MLDPVQHQALVLSRLCLNAFRPTPVDRLHVEANKIPLDLRRLKLAMQYAIKLFANPQNPAYCLVFTPKFEQEFLNSPRIIPSLGLSNEASHPSSWNRHLSSLLINTCQDSQSGIGGNQT